MSNRLPLFLGIGLLVIAIAVGLIVYANKGNRLELKGEIIKVRTGAIDEHTSAAMLDLRVENPSNVGFVVNRVVVTAEEPDGTKPEGEVISRSDIQELLKYNRFLGQQYNPALNAQSKIAPHEKLDRTVVVRFDIPQEQLDKAGRMRVYIQDVDGPAFETVKSMK